MYKVESYYSQKTRELYDKRQARSNSSFSTPREKEDYFSKNELLKILNRSVEEARKQILRRRVKQEIINQNRSLPIKGMEQYLNSSTESAPTQRSDEQSQIEDTIIKLVHHSKKKVSQKDFTAIDRMNMIDLFVNNEKTYLYIYRSLFETNPFSVEKSPKTKEHSS